MKQNLLQFSLAVLSGILTAVSLPGFNFFPFAFFALVPLFMAVRVVEFRKALVLFFISGLTVGLIYFYWVISSAQIYTGSVTLQLFAAYFFLCLYHAGWFVVFGAFFFIVAKKIKNKIWFTVIVASIAVCADWLHNLTSIFFPWNILAVYSQWNNLYLLQFSSFGGMWLVTFLVTVLNVLFFFAVTQRKKKDWIAAAAFITAIHFIGVGLVFADTQKEIGKIRAVILQENILAEKRWQKSFADTMATIFLSLNKQAVKYNPQIIVWSETAISWTFSEDDDLLNEVLRITYPTRASHIVGMLTPIGSTPDVYNSLYYIESDGKVSSRYDKKYLLAFLEQPLFSYALPFAHQQYSAIRPGVRTAIIPSSFGTLGALICNESLSPYPASSITREGVQALIVSSNDAWFANTVLADAHLALTRLRAVENRKDIIFNANKGFAGIISASGEMNIVPPSDMAQCIPVTMRFNTAKPIAAKFPDWFVWFSFGVVLLSVRKNNLKI